MGKYAECICEHAKVRGLYVLKGNLFYNSDTEEFVCESDDCVMHETIAWMDKPEPYRSERSNNHDRK